MKLIIQVPCFNESASLPIALKDLPRRLDGFDAVEWLVIDDGSSDETSAVARDQGVDHVYRLPTHRGLARAYSAGLRRCIELGADVIVNTDADNQYVAEDIGRLVEPILAGRAEIVVGSRPIGQMAHFSRRKRLLQRVGSWFVRRVSGSPVEDAPSGFRAITRGAAMRLNITSEYSYTLESLIQAGHQGIAIESVPVRVNPPLRPSRLMKSVSSYIAQSAMTIFRIFVAYRPMRFFVVVGSLIFVPGLILGVRFLYYWLVGGGDGKVQSVILSALLMGAGFFLITIGILADLIAVNRKLLEDVKWEVLRLGDERPSQAETTAAAERRERSGSGSSSDLPTSPG